jgi:alkylation response protein AidB-like acyl-CoA dehydrogenase
MFVVVEHIRCAIQRPCRSGWPQKYGGQELSSLARFIITEEMLASCAAIPLVFSERM